jgi:hypothetical protein
MQDKDDKRTGSADIQSKMTENNRTGQKMVGQTRKDTDRART